MRKNQISLNIMRFGSEVPKGYPNDRMVIHIYSDSNDLYAALSKAYAKAINVIEEWEHVGARCDISTNADGGIIAKSLNRRYNENTDLEYYDERLEMDKRLLGYIENSTAILDVIKSSDKENVRKNLSEKLGYSPEEIPNILRINFGMMTAEDIEAVKSEITEIEERLRSRKTFDSENN